MFILQRISEECLDYAPYRNFFAGKTSTLIHLCHCITERLECSSLTHLLHKVTN